MRHAAKPCNTSAFSKKPKLSLCFLECFSQMRKICVISACPYIFKKPTSTSVTPGQKATFYCDGVAETSQTITWYRGGHRIISSDKYIIEDHGKKLTVNNVKKDDLGEYKCVVSDRYGETSSTASLNPLNGKIYCFLLWESSKFQFKPVTVEKNSSTIRELLSATPLAE